MAKACASHGSRKTGPCVSCAMPGICSAATRAASSFRPSERSEREPEPITTVPSIERGEEIDPARIFVFNQDNLPVPPPLLELLLSCNGGGRIVKDLEINELVYSILGR